MNSENNKEDLPSKKDSEEVKTPQPKRKREIYEFDEDDFDHIKEIICSAK